MLNNRATGSSAKQPNERKTVQARMRTFGVTALRLAPALTESGAAAHALQDAGAVLDVHRMCEASWSARAAAPLCPKWPPHLTAISKLRSGGERVNGRYG